MIIKRAVLTICLALFGWGAVLAGVTVVSDAAPATVVLFPSKSFVENLPEDTAILKTTPYSITLASDVPDFALSLYREGAWIVLPSGLQGCAGRA